MVNHAGRATVYLQFESPIIKDKQSKNEETPENIGFNGKKCLKISEEKK